ncbi:MAG: LUD domain-containing protein [Actinomycetales bacterium]|nr:LUD domain-containing protein [Actinomycetales bacterium]
MTGPTVREEMLARVRTALGPQPPAPAGVPRDYRRTGTLPRGSAEALDLLADRLEDYRATVVRSTDDVAAAVAALLADVDSVLVPDGVPEDWLTGLTGTVRDAPPLSHDQLDNVAAVLTTCRVAIAETGTVVLDGGPGQGRRALTLVPDRHVVVVLADQVVHAVPDAVAVLAAHPHRPLTWISGPSATSDIELVRVEGVHGPRDLRVVIVAAPTGGGTLTASRT